MTDLQERLVSAARDARKAAEAMARGVGGAVELASTVGREAPAAAREFAKRSAPVLRSAAKSTAEAAHVVAEKAVPVVGRAVKGAGASVAGAARVAAEQVRAQARPEAGAASAYPHERVNARTGQRVVCEAYVRRPDGTRDHEAVFPNGSRADFGPIGNKVAGVILIMAGVPMLVLPGPGIAALTAGLYYLTKDGGAAGGAPRNR